MAESESQILEKLYKDLRLDLWWVDLLGQDASISGFDLDLAEERIPRTEYTAGVEVSRKFEHILSYIETRNRWYLWNNMIHVPCDGEGIAIKIVKLYYVAMRDALAFVKKVIDNMADAMMASNATDAEKKAKEIRDKYKGMFGKHRQYRDRLASDAGQTALVKSAKTECDVPQDHFDNDQRWFVMRNWVLDLDALRLTGQWVFEKHHPSMPITKYIDADYNPDLNLKHWDKFLETSIPNADMRKYLQTIVGAAFMGESKLRCIPNLYGPPHTGKSVFIGALFELGKGGAGYSVMPDSRAVTKVSGQNFEQDKVRGARCIAISEPSHSEAIDDDFLKKFTGDIWVETRTLNAKSTGWVPQGVIFVASNKVLKINTRDQAIVDRVQLIEFPVVFEEQLEDGPYIPEERRMIPGLENLIKDDRSRVLTWILQGMAMFVKGGRKLHPPKEVKALSDAIVVEGSTALRWIEDFVEQELLEIAEEDSDPQYGIPVDEAYMRYNMWAVMNGEKKPLPKRFFTQDIEHKYGDKTKGKDSKFPRVRTTAEYRRKYNATAPANDAMSGESVFGF